MLLQKDGKNGFKHAIYLLSTNLVLFLRSPNCHAAGTERATRHLT